ncbi:MAG: hypothetical protein E4H02_07205 [Lentisphaerales bacterium]|nr:MAG: hypothetical protein E4H02_07205 [Lentisphaerales bacterium]
MKRVVLYLSVHLACACHVFGQDAQRPETDPWIGKYPMSFFTKTRTANTVGKGRLSVCLKMQSIDCEKKLVDSCYEDMADTDNNDVFNTVLIAKYGWAEGHHVALGIPYMWVDFKSASKNIKSSGLGNIFVFEKWNCIKETDTTPGVAVDVWYYFDTGDSARKMGVDDDSIKATAEISKAWKSFSLHLNPGYCWNLDDGCDITEINAGAFYNAHKKLLLGIEYNYTDKEEKGDCHDIVPGFVWKPFKDASFKLGAVINADSTMTYKDNSGVVAKLFYMF